MKEITYGYGSDEVVKIETLNDAMKLKLCMILFKEYETLASLESIIKRRALDKAYKK